MSDLELAKAALIGEATCVLVKDGVQYMSQRSGISPMLGYLAEGAELTGFSAADRIVGKAAAMLFVKAGVYEVYAQVMSVSGRDYLESHGIAASFGVLTDCIVNRKNTGMCPMEQCVLNIDDCNIGYEALLRRVEELRNSGS